MALAPIYVICSSCGKRFRAMPRRTFLGFLKFKCPSCGSDILHPLTSGYRVAYWVILLLMVVAVVVNAGNGQMTFPGLIGIGVIVAVLRDAQLRRAKHKRLGARGPTAGGVGLRDSQPVGSGMVSPVGGEPETVPASPNISTSAAVYPVDQKMMRVLRYLVGIVAFLAGSYGVRAAIGWYRESTYMGKTPYERSMLRSMKGQGAYGQYMALMRTQTDSASAFVTMAEMTRRGITLLGLDDQARRIELMDHQLAIMSPTDCAAIERDSPDAQHARTALITGMDSISLDVFTTIIARAFLAMERNPGYRVPPFDRDEVVNLLRKAAGSLPEPNKSRFLTTFLDMSAATDTDACWAARSLYRFALGQDGGARASAIRLLTLLESQEGSSQ